MATQLKWRGAELQKYARKAAANGLKAAGLELHRLCRVAAGIPNTGVKINVKRRTAKGNKHTRTIYPHSSKPGEPPRRRTGFGQKNIVAGMVAGKLEWRTGFTGLAKYMIFHELGIHYRRVGYQRRPTLVPTLANNAGRLSAVAKRAAQSTKAR